MKSEEILNVFYGEKCITIQKNSNFQDLKQRIFLRDKKLVKFFSFAGKKIDENLTVSNFPNFILIMDQGEYQEFTKGKFRCKKCRRYVKFSKMTCNHSSKCRIFFNFKLKESMTKKIVGRYEETNNDIEEEEINEEEIDKAVNSKIDEIFNRHKRNMLQKINELLYNNK